MKFLHAWVSPPYFYQKTRWLVYFLGIVGLLAIGYGTWTGLFVAPSDYQQKDAFRIIYVHVPCAFLSISLYLMLGCFSLFYLIWKIKLYDILASNVAPLGAMFTFLALFTGALWGKPMWGTWWVWDARLTSELILLFIYFGYIGVRQAIMDIQLNRQIAAIVAIVGMINVPIIHYSVQWWQTLHQGSTLAKWERASMPAAMLYPLLLMIVGFYALAVCIMLIKTRTNLLINEKGKKWVSHYVR